MDGVRLKANEVPWSVSRLELVIAASLFRQETLWPTARDTNYWLGLPSARDFLKVQHEFFERLEIVDPFHGIQLQGFQDAGLFSETGNRG
jgi:hypothetical protein